jgi:hypothetical protein
MEPAAGGRLKFIQPAESGRKAMSWLRSSLSREAVTLDFPALEMGCLSYRASMSWQ